MGLKKCAGRAMVEFLLWMLGSFLVAALSAYALANYGYPALFKVLEVEEAVVGLISFVFTLPVTLAAAIVVIKLGDGMDQLTRQAEVRESSALAKEMYDGLFEKLKRIAEVLNASREDIFWMLHRLDAKDFLYSRSDENGRADLEDDRPTKQGFDSNGNLLPPEYKDAEKEFASTFALSAREVRKKIFCAIGDFIQDGWAVKQEEKSPSFLKVISDYRDEFEAKPPLGSLEEFYARNPGLGREIVKSIHENLRRKAKNEKSLSARLESSVEDVIPVYRNSLMTALVQIRIGILFCENGDPDEAVVRQIFKDVLDERTSFQEATDSLLGLAIFPIPIVELVKKIVETTVVVDGDEFVTECEDCDPAQWRSYITRPINQLGLRAIKDLRDALPTRDDLIQHVLGMVVPESTSAKEVREVRDEIKKRMEALPDPKQLFAVFMASNNQSETLS